MSKSKFTDDPELDKELNNYLESLIVNDASSFGEKEKGFIRRCVQDMLPLIPISNSAYYTDLIFIFYMDVKMGSIAGKKDLSQKDVEVISRWRNQKVDTLKSLGLDSKSLRSIRKGSLGDLIDEIVENSPFFDEKNEVGSLSAARKLMANFDMSTDTPNTRKDRFTRMTHETRMAYLNK